jgi:hypothetical protein
MLTGWQLAANEDLEGIPKAQIAEGIGESRQVVHNYLTLSGQKKFDLSIINKINEYRKKLREQTQALAANINII